MNLSQCVCTGFIPLGLSAIGEQLVHYGRGPLRNAPSYGPERRNGDYPSPLHDVLYVCPHNPEKKGRIAEGFLSALVKS